MSEPSPTSPCDFFISRTGVDAEWAQWIAWTLEEEGYTTYLQDWDFRPGRSFVHAMQEGTTNCKRTIAVLSPAYFTSAFSATEWEAAFTRDPTGAERALSTVRVEECDPPGLLARVQYIDLVGLDEEAARTVLLDGVVEGRRKPQQKPSFPVHPSSRTQAPAFPVDGLPKWKKIKVFEAIQTAGVSPAEFIWDVDGDAVRLRHRSSGAYFVFGGSASKYVVRHAAGDEPEWRLEKYSWDAVMNSVELWLGNVKRDTDTPDLWAD